jgi:prophage regulatory protein
MSSDQAANDPQTETGPKPRRFLRLSEVIQRVGMQKSAVYARIRRGEFPAPVQLGGGMVAWVEAEIDTWMDSLIQDRDAA